MTTDLRAAIKAWLAAPGDDVDAEAALIVAAREWLDAAPAPGLDVGRLQRMVERPLTSAYFEDYNAGRMDAEQVARALAGDYAALAPSQSEDR